MLKWLWLAVLVLIADQITKVAAANFLVLYQPVSVFPSFNLTLLHNTGAAFSFLSDAGGWQKWFFAIVAIGVTIALVLWLRKLQPGERMLAIALSLVIGGAVGNLIDRLIHGYVIDFLDVYYGQWHWPAFNLADSAISVGVAILLLDAIRPGANRHKKSP